MEKTASDTMPIHLDIEADDRSETVEALVNIGANTRETKTQELGPFTETWMLMDDPERNGFCV